jgi:hypothetical protein
MYSANVTIPVFFTFLFITCVSEITKLEIVKPWSDCVMQYQKECEAEMMKHEYEAKIMWMTGNNNVGRHILVHVWNKCYIVMHNSCLAQNRSRVSNFGASPV